MAAGRPNRRAGGKAKAVIFRPGDVLKTRLKAMAEEDRRSMAQMIVILLEEAIDTRTNHKEKR